MAEKGSSNVRNENDPPAKVLKISPKGSGKNKVINVNIGSGWALQGKLFFIKIVVSLVAIRIQKLLLQIVFVLK